MSKDEVILVRCQEHDYDYREWLEDVRLGYLLAVLRDNGIEGRVFDLAMNPLLSESSEDEVISRISFLAPRILVFLVDKHPTNNPFYTSRFIRRLIAEGNFESTHITLYGNTVVGTEGFFATLPVDSIVVGEESEFIQLVQAVLSNSSVSQIPGIALQVGDQIRINRPAPLRLDLDSLPFPVRYYFQLTESERHPFGYAAAILASRGCYGGCTFCNMRAYESVHGSYPWRSRSPNNIVDEMALLYSQENVREFAFVDPNFFGPGQKGQRQARSIAQRMIQSGLSDIAFSIYARADDVNYETFYQLKEAGLHTVFIGIESFSQPVLNRYRKGTTVAQNTQAIEILKDLDIYIRMGFITFDYQTSLEELEENVHHLRAVCASKPHLLVQPLFFQNVVVPLESTPLALEYEQMEASKSNVPYEFQQQLVEHQKRRARSGKITVFRDPRIAFVSEGARRLSAIVLQRSHIIERQMAELLQGSASITEQGRRQLASLDSWVSHVTPFVVEQMGHLVESMRRSSTLSDALDQATDNFLDACEEFDREHLGDVLELPRDPRISVID